MDNQKHYTYQEIMTQPEVWLDAIRLFHDVRADLLALWESNTFQQVIFVGCGSTYYLSLMASRLFQQLTHTPSVALPASELTLFIDDYVHESSTLLVAVSRSGTTTETIKAVELFLENANESVVAVTCHSESLLAQKATVTFAIDSAQEKSIVQTRSFSSMALVTQLMAATIANQNTGAISQLPELCKRFLDEYEPVARQLGENPRISRFFFLGSNTLYGIASEAMLKMKEMTLSYSEAYHTLELRHGPMSMITDESLVIGLVHHDSKLPEVAVLNEMQERGAQVLALGPQDMPFTHKISFPENLPGWCYPILYLPVLQLLAYHRALLNGLNPDKPHGLEAVVSLDSLT